MLTKRRSTKQNARWRARITGAFFAFVGMVFAHPAAAQIALPDEGLLPLGSNNPFEVIAALINIILGFLAFVAVAVLLYGGFIWMTAAGNPERVDTAKRVIVNAVIGLVIVLASWGIALWLIITIGNATGASFGPGDGDGRDDCIGCSIPSAGGDFYVLSTNPDARGEALLCSDITVRMSRTVDKTTVTQSSFFVRNTGGAQLADGQACSENRDCLSALCSPDSNTCIGDRLPGTIGFGPGDETAYFNFIPEFNFLQDTTYEATVTSDIRSLDGGDGGGSLSATPYNWSFTTGDETDDTPPTVQVNPSSPFPANGATDVCTNTVVNFDFSEPMRISSFNDETSFVLDYAGTPDSPISADWLETSPLGSWSFGAEFDYASARPAVQLEDFSRYSVRLFGGDPAADFAGAVQDSCGNPLDGNANSIAQGDPVDNFLGHTPPDAENAITWETGENAACTPEITAVTPSTDYYGEYAGLREGEACTEDIECGSGSCGADGACEGYGATTLTIEGTNLAPHPEVLFEGSTIYAAEGVNTCFNQNQLGNIPGNTAIGDYCLDDDVQSITTLNLRTPVGSTDSNVRVSVASEISEPAAARLGVLSPRIESIHPADGSAGQFITISGEQFGESIGQVVLRSEDGIRESIMELPEACSDNWDDDQIIAVAPETYINTVTGEEGIWELDDRAYVQVVHAEERDRGRHSDVAQFTFSDIERANLCAIEPTCSEAAGAEFTLTGERFGGSQGDSTVEFSSLTEAGAGYLGSITGWADRIIDGNTDPTMIQDDYWVTVFDGEHASNGVEFGIPCTEAPTVVEISQCEPDESIFPTPSPEPGSTNACLNAHIGILFDQEMNTGTYDGNVFFEQFNEGDVFDGEYGPLPVDISVEASDWQVDIGENNYYGFQLDVNSSPVDADQDGVSDGESSPLLQPNTWYQLTIGSGVESSAGVGLAEEYIMRFRTDEEAGTCDASYVEVSPDGATKNSYWGNPDPDDISYQAYTGSTYDAECRLLDPGSFIWEWDVANPSIGSLGIGSDGDEVQNVYVAGGDEDNEGTTAVNASIGVAEDSANFTVDLGFCESDLDCASCGGSVCNLDTSRCTPVINDVTTPEPSSGDHGTWVTINGCMFGPSKGTVFWNDGGISAETEWPSGEQCGDTWTADQIIAQVPDTYDSDGDGDRDRALPERAYAVEVQTIYGDADTSESRFTVNDIERAGLCAISPDRGESRDDVSAFGQNLGSEEGFASFLSDDDADGDGSPDRISADRGLTEWIETQIDTNVPVGATSPDGRDGFRAILAGGDEQCTDEAFCTNSVDFVAQCGGDGDCGSGCCGDSGVCLPAEACAQCETDSDCIAYGQCTGSVCLEDGSCSPVINSLGPDAGPHGGPVTINGCYFGSQGADSAVFFDDTAAGLFCSDAWSEDTIVAQVPAEGEISGTPNVNVRRSDGVVTAEPAAFTVTAQCSADVPVPASGVPLLCGLDPDSGQPGTADGAGDGELIQFEGDRFVDGQLHIFSDERVGEGSTVSTPTESQSRVPFETETGPVAVSVDACRSNTLEFSRSCTDAADCGDGYCVDGRCTELACGFCEVGGDESMCGGGQGCYYDADIGAGCCTIKPEILAVNILDGEVNVCPNSRFYVTFSEDIVGFRNVSVELFDSDTGRFREIASRTQFNPETNILQVFPRSDYRTDTEYRIIIPSSGDDPSRMVRSATTNLPLQEGDTSYTFRTASTTCVPDAVELREISSEEFTDSYTFSGPEQQTRFEAVVLSTGQEITPTDEVDWDYTWSPYFDEASCNTTAWIDAEEAESATEDIQTVESGDTNGGESTLTVRVNPIAGWGGATTPTVEDAMNIRTFFCAEDEVLEYADSPGGERYVDHIFPQHFSMIYCDTADVPTLNPIVSEGGPDDDWFLQYLFINPDNEDDAIGIRVYGNPLNLSPQDWYDRNVPNPGSPSPTTVDGYQAVVDGSSYYVGASNVIPDQDGDGIDELYNNIYLITFNESDAISDIREEVLDFFRFNINVSNYDDSEAPTCEAAPKQKLIRDTKRVNDLGSIANELNEYYRDNGNYPQTQSDTFGSFIVGLTTSNWNSWQGALGNVLGTTLPTDPYNFFYAALEDNPYVIDLGVDSPWVSEEVGIEDCEYNPDADSYFDESGNCWDPVNNEFFCPSQSHVYAYQRNDDDGADLFSHMEFDGNIGDGISQTFESASPITTDDDVCTAGNAVCSCFNFQMDLNSGVTTP